MQHVVGMWGLYVNVVKVYVVMMFDKVGSWLLCSMVVVFVNVNGGCVH